MTIPPERWLLDTNVWVFGLRRDASFSTCMQLLDHIGLFSVLIPLQVLKELSLVLSEAEIRDFYGLVNQYPGFIELSWEPATADRVKAYENRGCQKAMP